jgi:hypothetical protein
VALEREYNFMDTRTLKSMRAQMDHPLFKQIYFRKKDIWERMHPTGAMPQGELLAVVDEFEMKVKAFDAKAAKETKVPA